jgi:hypothetical protein
MIGANGAFTDRQRPLEQRQGFGIAAVPLIEIRQIVQRTRHVGMIGCTFSRIASERL